MNKIKTNDRFDRLCNLDISTHYREIEVWLFPSSFLSALAYWIVAQNPNKSLIDLNPALLAYKNKIIDKWEKVTISKKFTYNEVSESTSENLFESIPEILVLSELRPDFIDLGALSRNIFYMILREYITQCLD